MSQRVNQVEIGGVDGKVTFHHDVEDQFMFIALHQSGQRIGTFSMDYDVAERYANAILHEVEAGRSLRNLENEVLE